MQRCVCGVCVRCDIISYVSYAPYTDPLFLLLSLIYQALKFSPRPGSGLDAMADKLVGKRLGDEEQEQESRRGG